MRLIVGSPGDERQHVASRRQIGMQASARPDDPGRLHRPFRQRPLLETLDSADAVTARKNLKHAERDFAPPPRTRSHPRSVPPGPTQKTASKRTPARCPPTLP